jgi:RND family efflux transporter MFP subunit
MRLNSLVLFTAALSSISFAAEAPASLSLKATRAIRADVTRYISIPALIKPAQQAKLYAKVPGYLKGISADKGDMVQAEQLLAEIEVPELLADLAKQKAESEVANATYKRLLHAQSKAQDLVTPMALDEAAGKAAIAQAALERTQSLLSFSKIKAPFAGIITERTLDTGAFIPAATSGSASTTASIFTLMDFSSVRVTVGVPELEAPLVSKGQPVNISCEALPGKVFSGSVSRIGYLLDYSTKTMSVEADIPNPALLLRPGFYAIAKVGLEKHSAVISAPVEALVMEKTAAFVFKLIEGKAKKTSIKVGFNDGQRFEIVEGVQENDTLLLVGKNILSDGQAINATEVL